MLNTIVVTESYLNSVFQLQNTDRKKVVTTINEMMSNAKSSALSIHQIDRANCDETFRSARVNDNFRIIFSLQGNKYVLLFVLIINYIWMNVCFISVSWKSST